MSADSTFDPKDFAREAEEALRAAGAASESGNAGTAGQGGAATSSDQFAEFVRQVRAQILDWPRLADRVAPKRAWVVPDWIPAYCVTLLHGFGGVGKSLAAQQIGTAAAFKRMILGSTANACPVLGWWGEDDHDEIWRRQESINAALSIGSLGDLADNLIWRPCPGDDITLFTAANESDFSRTTLFEVLRQQIGDCKIKFAILDSAAQIAAIPENNRPLVTRCLQSLTGLCLNLKTTILLIGHNNKLDDFSGTTAWENRARSRIHMKREKDIETGEETIKLCRPKANYAEIEDGVALEWHRGAYRFTDRRFETYGDQLERQMRERVIDKAFLAALDTLTSQRRTLSASKQATNYAPKIMVTSGATDGLTQRDLEKAMNRLFRAGEIIADAPLWQKPTRHWATGLGRKIDTDGEAPEKNAPEPPEPDPEGDATFEPTAEWQDLHEGVILPPGLDIRLNMTSGRKQARLHQARAEDAPEPEMNPDATQAQAEP